MAAISTSMHFLENSDRFQSEKPYLLAFDPPDGVAKSNMTIREHVDILIEDIRGQESMAKFGKTGFTIMNLETRMQYEDFGEEDKVIQVYLKEVSQTLRTFLGAARVQVYEHLIRKRAPSFPISTGESYEFNQPTSVAHIDTTAQWTARMVEELCGESAAEMMKGRVQAVNVWKPLRGPVRDWPLALCDRSSVSPAKDVKPADLVFAQYFVENCHIHFSKNHKWYYLSDQQPNEAWIFLQSDSADEEGSGVPHSAFPLPDRSKIEAPRESIEVRALVYYAEK